MRILIISNLYPPAILGGYEILCGQVSERLAERGHTVHVLTSDFRSQKEDVAEEAQGSRNPTVERRLRLYHDFGSRGTVHHPIRYRTTRYNRDVTLEVISRFNPDVIFIWSQLRLTLGAAQAAELSKARTFYTFNDYYIIGYLPTPFSWLPRHFLRYLVDRIVYRQNALATLQLEQSTCISQYVKEELLRYGIPIENSKVIFQGIPIERFPCKEAPGHIGSPAKLLYAGQLHEYKGIHTLLDAFRKLHTEHPIRLTIAGEGDSAYVRKLQRMARGTELDVDFVGRLGREQIGKCYRDHDIFIFPSIWPEPFGLTHLEAMASGTPVVSTSEGGHGEFLRDGINALTFVREDADHLTSCLRRLIENPEEAHRFAKNARAEVETRFSLDRYVSDLENWLKSPED